MLQLMLTQLLFDLCWTLDVHSTFSMGIVTTSRITPARTSEFARRMTRVDCQQLALETCLSSSLLKTNMNTLLLSRTCCGHHKQSVLCFQSLRQSVGAAHTASMRMARGCACHHQLRSTCGLMMNRACTLWMQNFNWHLQQSFPCLQTLLTRRGRLQLRSKLCVWLCRSMRRLAIFIGQL